MINGHRHGDPRGSPRSSRISRMRLRTAPLSAVSLVPCWMAHCFPSSVSSSGSGGSRCGLVGFASLSSARVLNKVCTSRGKWTAMVVYFPVRGAFKHALSLSVLGSVVVHASNSEACAAGQGIAAGFVGTSAVVSERYPCLCADLQIF